MSWSDGSRGGEEGRDSRAGAMGGDNPSGMGGSGGNGGESNNISDITKAMLHSPTTMEYVDRALANYAAKPLDKRTGFWEDVSKLGTGLYDTLKTGFLGLVDTPINFANRFGANLPTMSPPPVRMAPLTSHDPTPVEQMRGYTDFGVQPPADVVDSLRVQDQIVNPGNWGFMDKAGVPAVAKFTRKALGSTLNPLAAIAMLSAGIAPEFVANPITQNATGFLTGGLAQSIADQAMFENTYDKLTGTGVYGDNPSFGVGSPEESYGGDVTSLGYTPKYQPKFAQGPSYGGYLRYGNYYG